MFKVDASDLNRLSRDLKKIQWSFPVATRQAVNRTLISVKSTAIKSIANETGLKQKTIRSRMIERRAKGKDLTASIDAKLGRAYNLITSVTKSQRKPGYFSRKLKSGKRKGQRASAGVRARAWRKNRVYRGTFIIQSDRGPLVVSRRDSSRRRGWAKFIHGPSIRNTFRKEHNIALMRNRVAERLPIELQRAIDYQKRKNNLR